MTDFFGEQFATEDPPWKQELFSSWEKMLGTREGVRAARGRERAARYAAEVAGEVSSEIVQKGVVDIFYGGLELGRSLIHDAAKSLSIHNIPVVSEAARGVRDVTRAPIQTPSVREAYSQIAEQSRALLAGELDAALSPSEIAQRGWESLKETDRFVRDYEAGKPVLASMRRILSASAGTIAWVGGASGAVVRGIGALATRPAVQWLGRSTVNMARTAGLSEQAIATAFQNGKLLDQVIKATAGKAKLGARMLKVAQQWGIPLASTGLGLAGERFIAGPGGTLQRDEEGELQRAEAPDMEERLGEAALTFMVSPAYVILGKFANAVERGSKPGIESILKWLNGKKEWGPHIAGAMAGFLEGQGFTLADIHFYKELLPALWRGDSGALQSFVENQLSSGAAFAVLRGRHPGEMALWKRQEPEAHQAPRAAHGAEPAAPEGGAKGIAWSPEGEGGRGGRGARLSPDPVRQQAVDQLHQSGWAYAGEGGEGWSLFRLPGYRGQLSLRHEGPQGFEVRVDPAVLGQLTGRELERGQTFSGDQAISLLRRIALQTNTSNIDGRLAFGEAGFEHLGNGVWIPPDLSGEVASRFGKAVARDRKGEWGPLETPAPAREPKARPQLLPTWEAFNSWLGQLATGGFADVSPDALSAIRGSLELVLKGRQDDPVVLETWATLSHPTFQAAAMRVQDPAHLESIAFHLSLVASGHSNADYAVRQIAREVAPRLEAQAAREGVAGEPTERIAEPEAPQVPARRPVDVTVDEPERVEVPPKERRADVEVEIGERPKPEPEFAPLYDQAGQLDPRDKMIGELGGRLKKEGERKPKTRAGRSQQLKTMRELRRAIERLREGVPVELVELEAMTLEGLRREAKKVGLRGYSKARKADLVRMLSEVRSKEQEREEAKGREEAERAEVEERPREVREEEAPERPEEARETEARPEEQRAEAVEGEGRGVKRGEAAREVDESALPEREPKGRTTRVKTESGREAEVEYTVVPARELEVSHDPRTLRARERYPKVLQQRERDRSMEQIDEIAGRLDPERLGESLMAGEGAPIVGYAGRVVESGNARAIALMRARPEVRERYESWLRENAERFGVDVEGVESPVLVRRRTQRMSGEERVKFTREANVSSVARMSPSEQARTDAELLDEPLMRRFMPGESGDILVSSNQRFIDTFLSKLPKSERDALKTREGNLSAEGERRIRNAVLDFAYRNKGMVERITESTDPEYRNLLAGFLANAEKAAKIRAAQERGDLESVDMPVVEAMVEGFRFIDEAKRSGYNVPAELVQPQLFGGGPSAEARAVGQVFHEFKRSPRAVREFMHRMLGTLEKYGDPKQSRMFDDKPSLREIVEAAYEQTREDLGQRSKKERPPAQTLFSETKGGGETEGLDGVRNEGRYGPNVTERPITKPPIDPQRGEIDPRIFAWAAKDTVKAGYQALELAFKGARGAYRFGQTVFNYMVKALSPVLKTLDKLLSGALTKPVMDRIDSLIGKARGIMHETANRLMQDAIRRAEKHPEDYSRVLYAAEASAASFLEWSRRAFFGDPEPLQRTSNQREALLAETMKVTHDLNKQLRYAFGEENIGAPLEKGTPLWEFWRAMEEGRRPERLEGMSKDEFDAMNVSYDMAVKGLARAAAAAVELGLLSPERVRKNYYPHIRMKKGEPIDDAMKRAFHEFVESNPGDVARNEGIGMVRDVMAAVKRHKGGPEFRTKKEEFIGEAMRKVQEASPRWMPRQVAEADPASYLLDPRVVIPLTIQQEMQAIAWRRWAEDVAVNRHLAADSEGAARKKFGYAPTAYRYVDPDRFPPELVGSLAGKWVDRNVFHTITRTVKQRNDLIESIYLISAMTKKALVTMNPRSALKQDVSQMEVMNLVGVPAEWAHRQKKWARDQIKNEGKVYEELVSKGEMGVEFALVDNPELSRELFLDLMMRRPDRGAVYKTVRFLHDSVAKGRSNIFKLAQRTQEQYTEADQVAKLIAYDWLVRNPDLTEKDLRQQFESWKEIVREGKALADEPVPDGVRNDRFTEFKEWAIREDARKRIRAAWNYKAMAPIFDTAGPMLWFLRFPGKAAESMWKFGLRSHPATMFATMLPRMGLIWLAATIFGENEDDRKRKQQMAGQGVFSPFYETYMLPFGRGEDGVMRYLNFSSYNVLDSIWSTLGVQESPYDFPAKITGGNPLVQIGHEAFFKGVGRGGRIWDQTDSMAAKVGLGITYFLQSIFPDLTGIPFALEGARAFGPGEPGERIAKRAERLATPTTAYGAERATQALKSRARSEETRQFERGGLRDEMKLRREMTDEMVGKSRAEKAAIARDYAARFRESGFQVPERRVFETAARWSTFRPAARSLMHERASVQIARIRKMLDADELTPTDARQVFQVIAGRKALEGAVYDLSREAGSAQAALELIRRTIRELRALARQRAARGARAR